MSVSLKLGGAALNQIPLDWENNLENIKTAILQAKQEKVDLLSLPEMCITGYGCEDLFLSDWVPQKAIELLPEIASWCQGICVSLGLPVRLGKHLYSCAALIQDGVIQGINAKQFLANDGVHYEPRWFTPWSAGEMTTLYIKGKAYGFGDLIHEVRGIKIGYEICEDAWRKDERPGYRLAKKGVKLIINPSASHFAFGKNDIREEIVFQGSKNFDCTYIYTNLLGNEAGRMIFDGEIFIAQNGKLIQRNERLSFKAVNMVTADINFTDPTKSYAVLNPDLDDKNTEFVKASALALFDYMRKCRTRGFVLSLSGGADSTTCAILVSEMVKRATAELGVPLFLEKIGYSTLRPEVGAMDRPSAVKHIMSHLLTCAYQGTKNSSEDTLRSARKLAESIGADFHVWTIDEEVASYSRKIEKVIDRPLTWAQDDIALQNIQARARSPIIWMLANIKNALLLTTSNRSEGDVGYATMDGDTSGSISPIAAVDKAFIIDWLQWAEKALNYPALSYVNQLSPSAELRPLERKQTDEDDLMPYDILVAIERQAIRDHKSPLEVYEILSRENIAPDTLLKQYITKFFRLWSRNQWKRERIAPSFHLDDFNVDPRTWCRFPILSSSFKQELEEL